MNKQRKDEFVYFIRFLKENNVFRSFKRNIEHFNIKPDQIITYEYYYNEMYFLRNNEDDLITYLDKCMKFSHEDFDSIVGAAFCWVETEEGRGFWADINAKWQAHLESKKWHKNDLHN